MKRPTRKAASRGKAWTKLTKAHTGGKPQPSIGDSLPLWSIRTIPEVFQVRDPNEADSVRHIADLAGVIKAQGSVDPISVWWSGAEWVCVDGHHRLAAYEKAGAEQVKVKVEVGTPQDIYQRPKFRSTAEFLGIANLLEGRVATGGGGSAALDTALGRLAVEAPAAVTVGESVLICFRPEDIHLDPADSASSTTGRIAHAAYLGAMTDYVVDLPVGLSLRVHVPGAPTWSMGDSVAVALPRRAALIRNDVGRAAA